MSSGTTTAATQSMAPLGAEPGQAAQLTAVSFGHHSEGVAMNATVGSGTQHRTRELLFLTHVGDPGGAEFVMMALCEAVSGSAEVMLLQHGSLESMLRSRQIKFSVSPMPGTASQVRRDAGWLSVVKAIPAALSMAAKVSRKGRQFDVVICVSQKAFVLASLAKPFMGRPIFWFMNDILSTDHFNHWLIRFLIFISRYSANHVVFNSKASLDCWLRYGGRRTGTSIIHPALPQPGAEPDRQQIAVYRRQFVAAGTTALIGMFGRISPWKGQEVFLRALALLPEVSGVIAGAAFFGDDAYETRIKALARELGIERRVVFAGHIEDVMTAMTACDVVAHCSTSPEPFGLVIVQSMLAGTPVVASDGGGVREILDHDDTGQLYPREDHRALATAIRRYLDDPVWAKAVAQKAQTRAKRHFSHTSMTTRFKEILETL